LCDAHTVSGVRGAAVLSAALQMVHGRSMKPSTTTMWFDGVHQVA